MNTKDKSLSATEKFIKFIKLKSKFIEFKANIEVTDLEGKHLCDSNCDCRFSDDTAHMNRVLYIYWDFNDEIMHQLDLHGYYNTTFQKFVFEEGILNVIDEYNHRILKLKS